MYELLPDLDRFQILSMGPTDWATVQHAFDASPHAQEWQVLMADFVSSGSSTLQVSADYSSLGTIVPVFSPCAVNVLKELLDPNGELLPLQTNYGPYYAYNCLNMVDAIDEGKSRIERYPDGRFAYFESISIRGDAVQQEDVFKVPQWRTGRVFVSQRFRSCVEKHALTGFQFKPVRVV